MMKSAGVYLIGGQSNALGVSPCAGLPAGFEYNGNALIYQSGAFKGALAVDPAVCGRFIPVIAGLGYSAEFFGLELGMAAGFADRQVFLIKYACDGTSLHEEWRPPSAGDIGEHYRGFIVCVNNGLTELKRAYNLIPRLCGLAWMQGESDAINDERAAAYESNLTALINDIRAELNSPGLPVAIGQILAGKVKPYAETVRAAQAAVAKNVRRTVLVETNGLETAPGDPWHFSARSELELGKRFASALSNIKGKY